LKKISYTVDGSAKVAGCHPNSVRRAIRNGTLPSYRFGQRKAYLVIERDLFAWVAKRMERRPTTPEKETPERVTLKELVRSRRRDSSTSVDAQTKWEYRG
jgi:excisionase family DNA binding protein